VFFSPFLQWVKILKTDSMVGISTGISNFPFKKGTGTTANDYPWIYVPDGLFIDYAGNPSTEPPTASSWTTSAAAQRIKLLSEFDTDFSAE
jgi:hypothetical protein